jgi:hypothetical protein
MINPNAGPIYRELTESDMDLFMFHLMKVPDVIRPALSVIHLDLFDQFSERHYRLLWAISSWYFTTHDHAPITIEAMYNEVGHRTEGSMEYDPRTLKAIDDKIQLYFVGWANCQPCVPYTLSLLSSFLYHRRGVRRLKEALANPTTSPAMITEIMKDMNNVEVNSATSIQPFSRANIGSLFALTPRESTGMTFLDIMLNGGVRAKEAYGFIAPSGGGKTTFSTQLALSCARRFGLMFIFSYEQTVDNDFLHPIFCAASGIPRSRMQKYDTLDDFNPKDRQAMETAMAEVGSSLEIFDFSGGGPRPAGNKGTAEFEAKLAEFASRGIRPKGIILDWFWHMVLRSAENAGVRSQDMRGYAQNMLTELKTSAGRYGAWLWINQQTAAAEASRKKVGEWNSAAELKSFANTLDFCFTLGALDATGVTEIKASKARAGKVQKMAIRLDGDHAVFRACSEDVQYDERTRQFTHIGQQNAIAKDGLDRLEAPKSSTATDFEGGEPVPI